MKYFLDTEFIEGPQEPKWLMLKSRLGHWIIGKPKPTIDLISIGIVAEDGREFYAISKDFNLNEAWNRYDLEQQSGDMRNIFPEGRKIYWLRENVLKPIWREFFKEHELTNDVYSNKQANVFVENVDSGSLDHLFCFRSMKSLLELYGKTNKKIAEEVRSFCSMGTAYSTMDKTIADIMYFSKLDSEVQKTIEDKNLKFVFNEVPEFYAYYADYDWVVFCWLFGKMMDLPEGFPMYCKDLKQDFDFYNENFKKRKELNAVGNLHKSINELKDFKDYPKQENEHSAIDDARWNKKLFDFLQKL